MPRLPLALAAGAVIATFAALLPSRSVQAAPIPCSNADGGSCTSASNCRPSGRYLCYNVTTYSCVAWGYSADGSTVCLKRESTTISYFWN